MEMGLRGCIIPTRAERKEKQMKITLQKHENGLIAVEQFAYKGLVLSFNPDDEKFYITTEANETLGKFKEFRNAVYHFKKRIKRLEEE